MMIKIVFILIGLTVYTGLLGHYIDTTETPNNTGCFLQENEAFNKGNTSLLPATIENVIVTFSGSHVESNINTLDWNTDLYSFCFEGFQSNAFSQYHVNWENALILSKHLNQIFPFHSFW